MLSMRSGCAVLRIDLVSCGVSRGMLDELGVDADAFAPDENLVPPDVLKRIATASAMPSWKALQVIISLTHDPRPLNAKKLIGNQRLACHFGQHRVVCSIDDAAGGVTVFNVAKRSALSLSPRFPRPPGYRRSAPASSARSTRSRSSFVRSANATLEQEFALGLRTGRPRCRTSSPTPRACRRHSAITGQPSASPRISRWAQASHPHRRGGRNMAGSTPRQRLHLQSRMSALGPGSSATEA